MPFNLASLSHELPFFIITFKSKSMEKANVTVFETKNFNAAGIDIGAEKIFVSPNGKEVVNFATYTADYYKCVEYLQTKGCTSVAMEATGVYWIALYSMLEACGLKVCLVNPKETKQIKGRKTDVMDCQHIQNFILLVCLEKASCPKRNTWRSVSW